MDMFVETMMIMAMAMYVKINIILIMVEKWLGSTIMKLMIVDYTWIMDIVEENTADVYNGKL